MARWPLGGSACIRIVLVLALLSLASATAADQKTAAVEGAVTFEGKPIGEGKISFHPKKGKAVTAEIKEGAYKATGLRVTLDIPGVPKKYTEPAVLVVESKPGSNTFDFALTR